MTPHFQRNKKYLETNGNFKEGIKIYTICFKLKKVEPIGKAPIARYDHASCLTRNYLVIHGGRNDDIYHYIQNTALNDIHLYDIQLNTWLLVSILGKVPTSRFGHTMCPTESSHKDYNGMELLIFGGASLDQFCDTTLYIIKFGKLPPFITVARLQRTCELLFVDPKGLG